MLMLQQTVSYSISITQKPHINGEFFKFNVPLYNREIRHCQSYPNLVLYEFEIESEFLTF